MSSLQCCLQMTATNDIDANFAACSRLAEKAAAAGCQLLALPECFAFIGEKDTDGVAIAEALDGPLLERYRSLARAHSLWLSLGGFQEAPLPAPEAAAEQPRTHRYNTHVLLDADGTTAGAYRKIHLFDIDVPGRVTLKESNATLPGSTLCVAPSPLGALGLTVCYDLRFPELFQARNKRATAASTPSRLSPGKRCGAVSLKHRNAPPPAQALRFAAGAEVMLIPAAFTVPTGQAHWEVGDSLWAYCRSSCCSSRPAAAG